jgi:hypothetical protein
MGYDIYAYAVERAPADPTRRLDVARAGDRAHRIAYLEMPARSPDARPLFEALDAIEFDGVVSGAPGMRYFHRDDVSRALHRLCADYIDGRASARTVRFLAETAERMSGCDWVYIEFF